MPRRPWTQPALWERDRGSVRWWAAHAGRRDNIFDLRRDRSDRAACRAGTYDLVIRVRCLVSPEIVCNDSLIRRRSARQRRPMTQPATRWVTPCLPMLLVALSSVAKRSFWGPGSKLKQGSVGSRDCCEPRSFTDRAKLVYAKHAASDRANQSVRQRAFRAHEYITTAPFVVDPGDYGRIVFDGPRASVG